MKKHLLASLILLGLLRADTIHIAVAANVSYAIKELTEAFHKTAPDTKVLITLGSSGKLTAQIRNGAPYGLFMAANMKYPQALFSMHIAVTQPKIYARGSLALLSSHKQDFSQGIALLDTPAISKIALANPKTAPYGKAAVEAMQHAKLYKKVHHKFIYGESISQTLSFAIAAADIGFIAKSSLFSPKMAHYKKGVHWASVDSTLYTPIDQGIVVLKKGENSAGIQAFYRFMQSPQAKIILKNYGYLVP